MIPEPTKKALNDIGRKLALILPGLYGKITFNFFDGKYVYSSAEETIKHCNPKKGDKNETDL